MTILQQIRQKALETVEAIDAYEEAYKLEASEEIIDNHRSNSSQHCVELAQLIMKGGGATEVLTKQS